ncbi:MAG: hypothetical protein AB7E95_07765 [Kiritimatiellales bacterium]
MNKATKWIIENLMLLAKAFPESEMAYDSENFTWIFIRSFPLPENIRQKYTRLIMITPGRLGPISQAPGNVYVDKGLTDLNGNTLPFIFDHCGRELDGSGFAWLSLFIRRWKPSYDVMAGDNLITLTNLIYDGFKNYAQ